jgi:glycerophosphoryl diester phosphodiesterase
MAAALATGCASSRYPANAKLKTGSGPLVQAHRGGRFEYDDNALGGFEMCLSRGIKGFELDVRYTKDCVLVVMHDESLERTTNGKGIVEDTTFSDLCKLRLKKSSEQVPSLSEVLMAMRGREDIFMEIEMKAGPSDFYTPYVLEDYCRRLNDMTKVLMKPGTYAFTCFNEKTLATMRKVDPDAPIGLIVGTPLEDAHIAKAKELGCCSVAPRAETTKEMVEKAHKAGLTVCLWMCQDKATWDKCAAKGADRVTSDFPLKLSREVE